VRRAYSCSISVYCPTVLILAELGFTAAALPSAFAGDRATAPDSTRTSALVRSVTIDRDNFGVPHVSGPTDAAFVFGFVSDG
jgi:acyl-homoserine lactone acylase PvdQ